MNYSQAEMDLMRYGYDGGGTYHGADDSDVPVRSPRCEGCGLADDACECEVE